MTNAMKQHKRIFNWGFKKKNKQKAFQLNRDTQAKFEAINQIFQEMQVTSVLDVGCNAGEITRLAGQNGIFAVGVDKKLDFSGVKEPLSKACLGNIEFNLDLVKTIPNFDAILLLSVHHQMIRFLGDEWTRDFVSGLAIKSKKVFLMEIASINSKYGKENGEFFIDNDETSVVNYAQTWFSEILPDFDCSYIKKIPQVENEPYRMLFKLTRKIK